MKSITLLAAGLGLSFALSTYAQTPGETCSPAGVQSNMPLMNTALHNVGSFAYVKDALAQVTQKYPGAQICVSGIALSRDIYQYPMYYLRVTVRASGGQDLKQMHWLFQDASTQAFDNFGTKPWVGLPTTQTTALISNYLNGLTLAPLKATGSDPATLAQSSATWTGCGCAVDTATLSVLSVDAPAGTARYFVSWLTQPGANPYASVPILKGILLQRDLKSGAVSVAENLWLTSALSFPMQNLLPAPDTDSADMLLTE